MEIKEIRTNIMFQIDDFERLINYCKLDKLAIEICSNENFLV